MSFKDRVKSVSLVKRISKTMYYSRFRRLFSGVDSCQCYCDDSGQLDEGTAQITFHLPTDLKKVNIGLIRDLGSSPRWTKYARFLKNNNISFSFYDIHVSNWIDNAQQLDIVIGDASCTGYHLEELRRKFYLLEIHMGIKCFPSFQSMMFYEDKTIEFYLSNVYNFPFAKTFITHDYEEAISKLPDFHFPLVSKIVPGSGSVGVELVRNASQCRQIIRRAFSPSGRKTHMSYLRQKNYVYFQEYVLSDGFDLRVLVINRMVFGYYRKALEGDFRASGMGIVEKRALPPEAMNIARAIYSKLNIPMLIVDMVRDKEGKYHIIELSPMCRVETPEQLHVNGEPGVYVFDAEDTFRFVKGRFWVDELALQMFFQNAVLNPAKSVTSG